MSLVTRGGTGITAVPGGSSPPVLVPPSTNTSNYSASSAAASASSTIVQPQTTWQKPEVFWAVTLILSAIIAGLCLVIGGYSVFGSGSMGNDTIDGIGDFLDVLAPYLLFAGGILGTIFYNVKFASKNKNCYTTKNYVLSVLCCPAGVLVTVVALVVLAVAIYIALVILVLAIIFAGLSGG